MRKIINFIQGSVRIEVSGAFPERFLNLCGTERLAFWDAQQCQSNVLRVTIPALRVSKARALAARAMCEVEVVGGFGLPAFLYRFRSRYALLAGLALAIFAAVILSQFVLVIQVTGNSTVPNSVILTKLETLGFGVGSYGPAVNRRELANNVLLELQELSFVSVNIHGIYAEVVVRESTAEPEMEDRWAAADIVASVDGTVVDVDDIIGTPLIEEGAAVLEGEVLISSVESHENGDGQVVSSTRVRAEGKVWAVTDRTLRAATPLRVTVKKPVGEKKTRYALRILRRRIALYRGNDEDEDGELSACKRSIHALMLPGGTALPLALEEIQSTACEAAEADVERGSAEKHLKHQLDLRLAGLLGEEGQVMARELTFSEEKGALTATLHVTCLEQIGRTVELEGEEGKES